MKFFISKWALTGGIKEAGGVVVTGSSGKEYFKPDGTSYAALLVVGKDVHETRQSAVDAAESLRARKLASLRRQIAKIESISFAQEGGK